MNALPYCIGTGRDIPLIISRRTGIMLIQNPFHPLTMDKALYERMNNWSCNGVWGLNWMDYLTASIGWSTYISSQDYCHTEIMKTPNYWDSGDMLSVVVIQKYLLVMILNLVQLRVDTGSMVWIATKHPESRPHPQLINPNQFPDSNSNLDQLRRV